MWQSDDLAGAVEDISHAIALQPHNVEFYIQRADYHLLLDQMERALTCISARAAFITNRSGTCLHLKATSSIYPTPVRLRRSFGHSS